MASLRLRLFVLLLLHAILYLSVLVTCDMNLSCHPQLANEEDNLLQGINSYRQSSNAPALTKNDKANCIADEIADQLENQPCTRSSGPNAVPANTSQFSNYPGILRECKIDPNTGRDGALLPVCVPGRVPTLVLTNYTQTQYAAYLNNSRYTGVGIGKEDDWVVMVLTTNTSGGAFANAACFGSRVGVGQYLVALLLPLFIVLVNYEFVFVFSYFAIRRV